MWIESVYVEGFGLHRELHLELSPGLNVLLGSNEAGKTTLHAFLRGMLHGLPRGAVVFAPLHGGRHGGTLSIAEEGARFRVERTFSPRKALRVLDGAGQDGGQALLDHLLRNVDAGLFRSVFAFDLDDLRELGLESQEIEHRLFDAGLLGAGRSVSGLVRELHEVKAALLRARSGPLKDRAEEIEALRGRLQEAGKKSKTHGALLLQEEALFRELEEERRAILGLRSQARRWELLDALWPDEVERRAIMDRLAGLPAPAGSAAALGDRLRELDEIEREGRSLQERVRNWEAELAPLKERRSGILPDTRLLALEARVDALLQERRFHEEGRVRIDELEAAIEASSTLQGERPRGLGGREGRAAIPWVAPSALAVISLLGLWRGDVVVAGVALLFLLAYLAAAPFLRRRREAEHDRLATSASALAERDALLRRVSRWEGEVAKVLEEAGAPEGKTAPGLALVELAGRLKGEKERAAEGRALDGTIGHLQREVERAREALLALAAKRGAILRGVGAADRAALEALVVQEREREGALAALRRIEGAFLERAGSGEGAEALRRDLESGERGLWEERAAEVRGAMEASEARTGELHQRLALLGKERQDLEASTAVQELALVLARKEGEWAEEIRKWRKAALLERLLELALQDLHESRQPRVLLAASRSFSLVTGGRYAQIRQVAEARQVEVVDATGRAVPASNLSRGTREQLYLCLRLGLAAAFAEQGIRLPILMDDVLVNFDPERAAAMAAVLGREARDHQILLLTCHPATAELLEGAVPGLRKILLSPRQLALARDLAAH